MEQWLGRHPQRHFTTLDVPHAERQDLRRHFRRNRRPLIQDEKVDREEAGGHSRTDGGMVCPIAPADTTSANRDDRVLAEGVSLPEIVHAVADILVGVHPPTLADLVTYEQMEVATLVVLEADDTSERCLADTLDILDEGPGNSQHVVERHVHAENDVSTVGGFANAANLNVFNHEPSLSLYS